MSWMDVEIEVVGREPVKNVINTEAIIRFGPRLNGTYVRLVDGSSIDVLDSFEEILQAVLKAQSK